MAFNQAYGGSVHSGACGNVVERQRSTVPFVSQRVGYPTGQCVTIPPARHEFRP